MCIIADVNQTGASYVIVSYRKQKTDHERELHSTRARSLKGMQSGNLVIRKCSPDFISRIKTIRSQRAMTQKDLGMCVENVIKALENRDMIFDGDHLEARA